MGFSNHGKYIILVDSHETLVLYDLISSKEILSFQEKNIFDVAINSRLGLMAVSNSINNKIKLCNGGIIAFNAKTLISLLPKIKMILNFKVSKKIVMLKIKIFMSLQEVFQIKPTGLIIHKFS